MRCIVCGEEFTPTRPWQKYCCVKCKRYANRRLKKMKVHEEISEGRVIREFNCRKCGTLVQVRDHKDFRMKFCCKKCEEAYWKHSHKAIPPGPVFRFRCETCGKEVTVSDPKDKRKRFCSALCRSRWNTKSRNKKVHARAREDVLKEG